MLFGGANVISDTEHVEKSQYFGTHDLKVADISPKALQRIEECNQAVFGPSGLHVTINLPNCATFASQPVNLDLSSLGRQIDLLVMTVLQVGNLIVLYP